MSDNDETKINDVIIEDYVRPMLRVKVTDDMDNDMLNGYTLPIEDQINKIYLLAQERKFLHEYSENANLYRSKLIGYPARLLSTITASIAGVNIVDMSFSPLALAVLSMVSSVLSMTDSFLENGSKYNLHKVYKNKFHTLINNIEKEMVLDKSKRKSAEDYLSYITDQYTTLCNGSSPSFSFGSQRALNKELETNKEINKSIFKLHNLHITPSTPRNKI